MPTDDDSIVDRAQRVHHSLQKAGEPSAAQVAVGGPCPGCGERVELVLHSDTSSFACRSCGTKFSISS